MWDKKIIADRMSTEGGIPGTTWRRAETSANVTRCGPVRSGAVNSQTEDCVMWHVRQWLFWERITVSHVHCYSVNHSKGDKCTLNYCVNGSILTFQISQGSASTYFRWSGNFRHSFVKGFFRDNPSNFYWNRFIFDRQRAKNKLAQFFWDGVSSSSA